MNLWVGVDAVEAGPIVGAYSQTHECWGRLTRNEKTWEAGRCSYISDYLCYFSKYECTVPESWCRCCWGRPHCWCSTAWSSCPLSPHQSPARCSARGTRPAPVTTKQYVSIGSNSKSSLLLELRLIQHFYPSTQSKSYHIIVWSRCQFKVKTDVITLQYSLFNSHSDTYDFPKNNSIWIISVQCTAYNQLIIIMLDLNGSANQH